MLSLVLTCCFMTCLFPSAVKAEGRSQITITANYYSINARRYRSFPVQYDDSWFQESAAVYNHSLARASLGLMASSFRLGPNDNAAPEADNSKYGRVFLTQAGFEDLRCDDYDKKPGRYTVASIIGRKELTDRDGTPFTLLAVGISGQGYRDEWLSNLSIGDSDIHDGFREAASDLYDRIFGYIAEHRITGRIKLWTSGFSRGAAVGNVFSMMLINSGQFDTDDLYAYLYATPRNTRLHTDHDYPGIFNIVGMNDPIPQIPFESWGYDRYGVTFYLPSQETDSDYHELKKAASVYYQNLTGNNFTNNPEMNARVKMLLEYLSIICPTPTIYKEHLQDILLSFWSDKSPINLLGKVLEIADDPVLITPENEREANGFLNFLCYLIYDYFTNSDEFSARSNSPLSTQLMREHTPDVYISWMMSHDMPYELFAVQNEYTRVVVSGMVDVDIYDPNRHQIIERIHQDGTVNYPVDGPQLFAMRQETQTIVIVPKDQAYSVIIRADNPQTVQLIQIHYTSEKPENTEYKSSSAEIDSGQSVVLNLYPYNFEEDKLNLVTDENTTKEIRQKYEYSTSSILQFERLNVFHLNWRINIILLLGITAFLAAVLAFQVTYAVGKLRWSRKRKAGIIPKDSTYMARPIMALCTVFVLFFLSELVTGLYLNTTFTSVLFKLAIGLLLFYVSDCGYRQRPSRFHYWIRISMLVELVANLTITFLSLPGIILHCAAIVLHIYAYTRYEKPAPWQWAASAVIVIQGSQFILLFLPQNYGILLNSLAVFYLCGCCVLFISALGLPRRFLTASLLLLITGILMINHYISGESIFTHFFTLGFYYAGLSSMAAGTLKVPEYRLVPEIPETDQPAADKA